MLKFEPITIKGKEYKLRYGTYALENLESDMGGDLFDEKTMTSLFASQKGQRMLLYWGLKTTHKEINKKEDETDPDSIYNLMDHAIHEHGLEDVIKKCVQAFSYRFPQIKEIQK